MICLYLYEYLLLYNIPYILRNRLMSIFQRKFNCVNLSSCLWDISRQSFYSYWYPDISVICCCFCISYICVNSPHLGLSSATYLWKSVYWLWRYKLNEVCDISTFNNFATNFNITDFATTNLKQLVKNSINLKNTTWGNLEIKIMRNTHLATTHMIKSYINQIISNIINYYNSALTTVYNKIVILEV